MSMFTDLVNSALGANTASSETQTQDLLRGALDLLQNAGGVQGIAEKFQQSGLGDIVASWIGTDQNQAISADQLTSVLGQDQITELSQRAGIPADQGANALARVFPALLDKLTPDGILPDKSQLMTIGKVILGGIGVAAAAKAAATMFGGKDEEAEAPTAATAAAAAPGAAATSSANSYTVAAGDTLSKISNRFYGDANQWQRIFDANRDVLTNPDRIFPGQVLRIP